VYRTLRRVPSDTKPARAVTKWAMYAVSASDDGMSGPRWQRTHMPVANPDWWDLMLLGHLPYQVYNILLHHPSVCAHAPVGADRDDRRRHHVSIVWH